MMTAVVVLLVLILGALIAIIQQLDTIEKAVKQLEEINHKAGRILWELETSADDKDAL